MCEKCAKYLDKSYKNCPKCGALLTSKYDHDKKTIAELEKISTTKYTKGLGISECYSNSSYKELNFEHFGNNNFVFYNLYRKLILSKINFELDDNDRIFIITNCYTQWLLPYCKENIKSYIEDRINSLLPTKIITLEICLCKREKTTGKLEDHIYQTLIFTEHEIESIFEFLRGKNWLTKDVSETWYINNYIESGKKLSKDHTHFEQLYKYNSCSIQMVPEKNNISISEQEKVYRMLFVDSKFDNIFSLNKVFGKYTKFIINDLILKEIEPKLDNKLDNKLETKLDKQTKSE